ncbi:hypothetical protein ADIS_0250 [Lunatimonas lonarensis]|uniref:Uncharacterized protein n=1 Tax=Lunatimonas lonarensis TaxID=1232681 RepID=R7ZYT0_9BACT|nr:hypothetical protein ADIS_0250 [Lunatimonas lonarensis]
MVQVAVNQNLLRKASANTFSFYHLPNSNRWFKFDIICHFKKFI